MYIPENIEIIIIVSIGLLRILSFTYIGSILKLNYVWSFIIQVVSLLPVFKEVLDFIREQFDKYQYKKGVEIIDKYAYEIYYYIENIAHKTKIKGDKKLVEFKNNIKDVLLKENIEPFVINTKLDKYIEQVAETINAEQNNEGPVKFIVKQLPILDKAIGILFGIVKKVIGI